MFLIYKGYLLKKLTYKIYIKTTALRHVCSAGSRWQDKEQFFPKAALSPSQVGSTLQMSFNNRIEHFWQVSKLNNDYPIHSVFKRLSMSCLEFKEAPVAPEEISENMKMKFIISFHSILEKSMSMSLENVSLEYSVKYVR